jgi:hypothetical protein
VREDARGRPVRRADPGVVVDRFPQMNADSMSMECSMPFIFACRFHSVGCNWNPLARSVSELSNGVRKICVLLETFTGMSDRAGLDVSFSGCAVPMIISSSPEFMAMPVPTPDGAMFRVAVRLLVATASTRNTSPVRVSWTRSHCAKYGPLTTATVVATFVTAPDVASNRALRASSTALYCVATVRRLSARRVNRVSGLTSGSSSVI